MAQNEIATVKLGEVRMMAEVIKVVGDDAYIQVFDSTRGLRMGAEVEFEGHMLKPRSDRASSRRITTVCRTTWPIWTVCSSGAGSVPRR